MCSMVNLIQARCANRKSIEGHSRWTRANPHVSLSIRLIVITSAIYPRNRTALSFSAKLRFAFVNLMKTLIIYSLQDTITDKSIINKMASKVNHAYRNKSIYLSCLISSTRAFLLAMLVFAPYISRLFRASINRRRNYSREKYAISTWHLRDKNNSQNKIKLYLRRNYEFRDW